MFEMLFIIAFVCLAIEVANSYLSIKSRCSDFDLRLRHETYICRSLLDITNTSGFVKFRAEILSCFRSPMKITCHIIPEKICKYNFYTVTKYLEQCRLRNDQYIKSENLDPPNILKDRAFYSVVILFILSVSHLRSLLKNSINCKKGASIDIKYVLKITGFLFWDFVTSNWFLFVVSYLFCAFKKKHRLKHCKNCMLFEVFKYLSELFLFKFYLSGWTLTALICLFTRVLGKQNLIT